MENTFDLEQFKQGVPAYTRNGRKDVFVGIWEDCAECSQLISCTEENDYVTQRYLNGECISGCKSDEDLIRMQGPYDHIKKGDLVMVWLFNEDYSKARLQRFKDTTVNGDVYVSSRNFCRVRYDNCLTVEEYAEKYL